MKKDDLANKVNKADPDIAFCAWKECKERGQYRRCYFDLYELCPKYLKHKNYLRTVKEMRKKRHHPEN